jgi:hypothetical protein
MKKALVGSVVAVLLVGTSAMAQINLQYQDWQLGLNNSMSASGGVTTVGSVQGLGTLSTQNLLATWPVQRGSSRGSR